MKRGDKEWILRELRRYPKILFCFQLYFFQDVSGVYLYREYKVDKNRFYMMKSWLICFLLSRKEYKDGLIKTIAQREENGLKVKNLKKLLSDAYRSLVRKKKQEEEWKKKREASAKFYEERKKELEKRRSGIFLAKVNYINEKQGLVSEFMPIQGAKGRHGY